MAKRVGDELLVGDRVRAAVDLPGVPEGTRGRVILSNGFEWIRYRVVFDNGDINGHDIGSLHREQLVLVDRKGEPVAV